MSMVLILLLMPFFYLSLFDIGDDFRSNPFKKRRDDTIQTTPNDL
jgi:hypothetical protein